MVANLVRVESRFATIPQSGPSTHTGLQVVTQSIHNFDELFSPVSNESTNLRLRDSVENRDSHNDMNLGRCDTVQNLIIKPSRTSKKNWLPL